MKMESIPCGQHDAESIRDFFFLRFGATLLYSDPPSLHRVLQGPQTPGLKSAVLVAPAAAAVGARRLATLAIRVQSLFLTRSFSTFCCLLARTFVVAPRLRYHGKSIPRKETARGDRGDTAPRALIGRVCPIIFLFCAQKEFLAIFARAFFDSRSAILWQVRAGARVRRCREVNQGAL
jgi:hypothetical protein